jgi:ribosome-binding protein aMBF1 (putative translation factor)
MKCEICGMRIKGEPVIEEIDGEQHYYCCRGCLIYTVCTRDGRVKKYNLHN